MNVTDSRKSAIAFALSTILVLGTIVMPLSHYGWMLASGRFDHHGIDHTTSSTASHADGMSSASDDDRFVEESELALFYCDYATTVILNPVVIFDSLNDSLELPHVREQLVPTLRSVDARSHHLLPWFRGPPIV